MPVFVSAAGVGVWQGSMFLLRDAVLAVSARRSREQSVLPVRDSSRDTRDCTQRTNLGWELRAGSRQRHAREKSESGFNLRTFKACASLIVLRRTPRATATVSALVC